MQWEVYSYWNGWKGFTSVNIEVSKPMFLVKNASLENGQVWYAFEDFEINHVFFMTTYVFCDYRRSPQGCYLHDGSFCNVQFWVLLFFFWSRVSLRSSGWFETYYMNKNGFDLQQFSCPGLLSAGITGIHYHAQWWDIKFEEKIAIFLNCLLLL